MITEYKILSKVPATWRELQEFVAMILSDCGFATEIEKTIETVRGKVEIDVYADRLSGFQSKVLCECKYWNGNVPQSVIHSFRTVVIDYGASQGFIISKNGFQKGAYEAVYKSNVCLLTWDEFEKKFEIEWLKEVIDRNQKIGKELMNVAAKIIEVYHKNSSVLEQHEFDNFQLRREEYSDFLWFTFKEHYIDLLTQELSLKEINSRIGLFSKQIPTGVKCFYDYFNYVYERCQQELSSSYDLLELIEAKKSQ